MRPRLRLYTGDHESTSVAEPTVPVKLGDLAEILYDAMHSGRAWVEDFMDDDIQISSDLYDVLSAYLHLRPGA